MRSAILSVCLTLCCWNVYAQPPAVEWSHIYGGSGFESMWAMIPSPGGRYLVAGETGSSGVGGQDFWIMMLDASGSQIWTRTYGTADDDGCTYCIATSDGGFMAVGWRGYAGSNSTVDGWMIKLNANGDSTWSRVFGGAGGDHPYWVEQTADGGYIIVGTTNTLGANGYDGWLVKTDAGGVIQWQRTFGGSDYDQFISVEIAGDGGFVMAGDTRSSGAGEVDGWLVKTNSNGDSLWSRTFGTALNEGFFTLEKTSDQGFLLVGYRDSLYVSSTDDWMIVKTDAAGISQWTRFYGYANQSDSPWQGQQTADGGYIIGGYFEYPDSLGVDMVGLRLDANGDSLWSVRFSGDAEDLGWFAYVTPDGGYLFGADTWSSWSAGYADWWVVKTQTECDDITPQTPQVVIQPLGSSVRLHWNPVTQSITGCPISATHYLVFYSPTSGGPYYYHGYTVDTSYVHLGVIAYAPGQFYHVIASTAPLPTLQMLPPAEARATEAEVLQWLRQSEAPSRIVSTTPRVERPAHAARQGTTHSPAQRRARHTLGG